MDKTSIIDGIMSIFQPIIYGFGRVIKIFFDMPEIAGLTVGQWLLCFVALSFVFRGLFDND